MRVNIEPQNVSDLDALSRRLEVLHRADQSVALESLPTGENVMGCMGDERVKQCITDLQSLYARGISLRISQFMVAVREPVAHMIDKDRIDPKSSVIFLPSWAFHIGLAAATAQENDLEIRGKIQTAQVMNVISWCTYQSSTSFQCLEPMLHKPWRLCF